MNTRVSLSVFALAASLCSTAAFASQIPLNTTPAGSYGTAVAGASVSASAPGIPTMNDPTPFIGTYTESVYLGGTGAMCSSCLNFVFNITNTATASNTPDSILELATSSFAGYTIATDYITGTGTAPAPTDTEETINGTVNYNFDGATGITPGETSDTLVIFTNAMAYTNGSLTFQDGTVSAPTIALMPAATTATPEPSSLALLGTGLVGVAGLFRRRFQA